MLFLCSECSASQEIEPNPTLQYPDLDRIQNPEATRIWTTYMWGDLDALSEAERMQGFFLFGSTLRRLENVHNQYQLGTISEDAWRSRQGMYAGIARSKAFAVHLEGPAKGWMAGDFLEFMNRLAAEDLESDA